MKALPPTLKAVASHVGSFWPPKPKHWLLFLIFVLASTQFGLHLWPVSSLVYGVRVDYLSPALYLLDILIIVYLFLNQRSIHNSYRFSFLIPPLLINLLYSQNPLATLSWLIHLLLYIVFIFSIPKKTLFPLASITLLLGMFFQVTLGSAQAALGRSLQGPLYYLGERLVSVGQPGVALSTFLDQIVLRAYGTFGHPNVLAGWLVLSCLILLKINKYSILNRFVLILSTLSIFLTQSRSAGLTLFGIIIPFYFLSTFRTRLIYLVACLVILFASPPLIHPARADLSVSERRSLQILSLQVLSYYPILGTGANASISVYPELSPNFRLLQPDHNSLTLLLSWLGFFGIFVILYYFLFYFKFRISNLGFLIPILPLLLLDHYLLTSPQGVFILILYLNVVHYTHAQSNRQ